MGDGPRVSVVIVNYNGWHHLEECLTSLQHQTFRDFEVIVVDNGSSDGSPEWVRRSFPEVRLVENRENRGFCGGNNDGIAVARGELLFLLNNDTVLEERCLEELTAFMDTAPPHCIGAFPLALFHSAPSFINGGGVVWNRNNLWRDHRMGLLDSGRLREPERVFGSMFVAVMFRRREFLDMGGFDESMFTYGEDFDLSYRANALGHTLFLVPRARLYHKFRASSQEGRDPLWSFYLYMRNYYYMVFKDLSWREIWASRAFLGRIYLLNLRWGVENRQWRRFWLAVKVPLALMRRIPNIWRWRRFMAEWRRAPDFGFWDTARREPHSIFCYCGHPVFNLLNVRTALKGPTEYEVDGERFTT